MSLMNYKVGSCTQIFGIIFFLCFAFGCSKQSGFVRYRVTGRVTVDGKPAPVAEVFFQPDPKKGSRGPGSVARVELGEYKTREGKGVTAGQHIVDIVVFDGVPSGDSLDGKFILTHKFTTSVDIPANNSEQNFEIPKSYLRGE